MRILTKIAKSDHILNMDNDLVLKSNKNIKIRN